MPHPRISPTVKAPVDEDDSHVTVVLNQPLTMRDPISPDLNTSPLTETATTEAEAESSFPSLHQSGIGLFKLDRLSRSPLVKKLHSATRWIGIGPATIGVVLLLIAFTFVLLLDRFATMLLGPLPDALVRQMNLMFRDNTVRPHLQFIAHDLMEGREPGARGESLVTQYVASQFKLYGLQPVPSNATTNGNGTSSASYFQNVPLRGSKITSATELTISSSDASLSFRFPDDFVLSTDTDHSSASFVSDQIAFVGYGIRTPPSSPYNWDDYKDLDVRGKVLIVFVNDPPATPEDPDLFKGDELTYYGRWTYKFEQARRMGAKGVLLVHTNETAGYSYAVPKNGALQEHVSLRSIPTGALTLRGWINEYTAQKLISLATGGKETLSDWFAQAGKRTFQPRLLDLRASISMNFDSRTFSGTNVVGIVQGNHPIKSQEYIVFTAHHDHLGTVAPDSPNYKPNGDNIYNGAVDNASGMAGLLMAASLFARFAKESDSSSQLQRSMMFCSLTAEESGLLGSQYFVEHPVVPLKNMVANINFDVLNVYGKTNDIVGIGVDLSDLDKLFSETARDEGMFVSPDDTPNLGHFFRSDQLNFFLKGVPAVNPTTGSHFVGKPDDYARTVFQDYSENRYHQTSDQYDSSWSMAGLIQQIRMSSRLGWRLASDLRLQPKYYDDETLDL